MGIMKYMVNKAAIAQQPLYANWLEIANQRLNGGR